jgi:hypothetical protein
MLFSVLILASSPGPCDARPLGWTCAAQRISQRSADERGVIYAILEAQAAKDAKRLDVSTPGDRCWTAKVVGFEYIMLAMATPKGSKLHNYYDQISSAYQARVAGKLNDGSLVSTLRGMTRPQTTPPTEAAMKSALDGELRGLIDRAANALIANAKIAATSFKPQCAI